MAQITLTIEDDKLGTFIDLIKKLNYVSLDKNSIHLPTLTKKQIIERVSVTNEEIKQGNFITQEQLQKKIKNW